MTNAQEAALRDPIIIIGVADRVPAAIDQYRRAVGGEIEFIARLYFRGLPRGNQREALRVFAREVVPPLRKTARSCGA